MVEPARVEHDGAWGEFGGLRLVAGAPGEGVDRGEVLRRATAAWNLTRDIPLEELERQAAEVSFELLELPALPAGWRWQRDEPSGTALCLGPDLECRAGHPDGHASGQTVEVVAAWAWDESGQERPGVTEA